MNLVDPDAFIARHNLLRYEQSGVLDVEYLSELSSDAAPVIRHHAGGAYAAELERVAQRQRERDRAASWQATRFGDVLR